MRAERAPFLESDAVPSPDGTDPDEEMQWPGTKLQQSPFFLDIQQAVIKRRLTTSAPDYVGYLSTVSAYLQLPQPKRQQAYGAITRVLSETVEIAADIIIHLARRRSG
ncbi:hypothetical protein BOQ63_005595 (plasmid) [Streptomyces viridifaciens]|uniref:hypothetical protein n=1 Tax=Kitasatospora aureofaciens TaxID=1894 RepID=UPI0011612D92|nr:hypothetical protein BOQ63_005595 [Streptomyces viridifaciens]